MNRKMRKSRKSRKMRKMRKSRKGGSPSTTITFTFPLSRHNPEDWDDLERVIIADQNQGVRDEAIRYLTNLDGDFLYDLMHCPPNLAPFVVSNPIANVNEIDNVFELTVNVNQPASGPLNGWIRSVVDHLQTESIEVYSFGPFPLADDRYWRWN